METFKEKYNTYKKERNLIELTRKANERDMEYILTCIKQN